MIINIHNYEAYFLDYHEGRLDRIATGELMLFLNQNPQLKEEFESFENITLNLADDVKFDDKAKLKKYVTAVNPSNFDEIAAQEVDGTLNKELQQELEKFVRLNPAYEKELILYRNTKLVPDTSIFFEDKESLKRNLRRPAAWYYWSAAASVALLIGAYFMLGNHPADNNIVLTHNHNVVDTATHKTITPQPANNTPSPVNVVQNEPKKSNPSVVKTQKHIPVLAPAPMPQYVNTTAPNDSIHIAIHPPQQKAPLLSNDSVKKSFAVRDSLPSKDSIAINVNIPVSADWNNTEHGRQSTLKRILVAVSNPFRSVGRFFRHPINIRKCYSKETDKVIAYQVDLGDSRFTFPKKNSSY